MQKGAEMRMVAGVDLQPLAKTVTQAKIARYAEASGDANPLHTDPAFAAAARFGGTVAHGMLILAYASEMLTSAFGERWVAGGRLKARFRAPARPGDSVSVSGRVLDRDSRRILCHVEARNQAGEVLISADAEVPA